MQKELHELISRHCETLARECEAIEKCLIELDYQEPNPEPILSSAIAMTHKIKGSSGTIGFGQVSECATALESYLRTAVSAGGPIGHEFYCRIMAWFKRLDNVISALTMEQSTLFDSVSLKMESDENLTQPESKKRQFGLHSENILIVDDCDDARALLSLHLQKAGFATFEARNGIEAIVTLEKEPISLVLLDLTMPLQGGVETLKCIRQEQSLFDLPVIIVTADRHSDSVVNALSQGANDYVSKPVDTQCLTARINAQIQRRNSVAELKHTKDHLEKEIEERARNLEKQQTLSMSVFRVAHASIVRDVETIEQDLSGLVSSQGNFEKIVLMAMNRCLHVHQQCELLGLTQVASAAAQLYEALNELPALARSGTPGNDVSTNMHINDLIQMCKEISVDDLKPNPIGAAANDSRRAKPAAMADA